MFQVSSSRFYNNKGFTLIEVSMVIAIIGLLSSIVLVSMNTAKEKARDAKRKSDLNQIRKALEVSVNNRGYYPGDGQCNDKSTCWNSANPIWRYLVTEDKLLSDLPVDPINDATYYYYYEPNSFNQGTCNESNRDKACEFVLRARLESGGYYYNDSFGVGVR